MRIFLLSPRVSISGILPGVDKGRDIAVVERRSPSPFLSCSLTRSRLWVSQQLRVEGWEDGVRRPISFASSSIPLTRLQFAPRRALRL